MSLASGALSRAETDLTVNIKKATSVDETAPKRKHVRACIVYTWDHRSGRAFWNGIKIQPLHGDEVQLFKGLITIHTVLQEGHMSVLREAQSQVNWIESLGRGTADQGRGYGKLIREYVGLLLRKLSFHRTHPAFNGTFEYEEYISLRTINDPNEGYEAIIDLMNLQDAIDDFQRIVFSSLSRGRANECKISSLTPMVAESYGIFQFATSMLRAMHQTTNDDEALEPLRSRYYTQYVRLRDFYYDCSSLKYLRSLITIPNLPADPPNLYGDDDRGPALPKRPQAASATGSETVSARSTPAPPPPVQDNGPEPAGDWWADAARYEEEQNRLEAQRQAEIQQQQMLMAQQQAQYEEQQRLQAEQQRQAQEALMRDQLQRQAQGQVAELERDILNLKGQYEQNQLLLEQYDNRVKALENELQQVNSNVDLQMQSKNELIQSLQEQLNAWKNKYEALAKLYSQLRQEHLDLLSKHKQVKAKAASAQEAIDKRERLERDIKAKNLELADMIRERDRARYELDKNQGGHKDQIEKLERDLRLAQDKLNDAERAKGADLSLMISKHNRELSELEEALKAKQRIIDDFSVRGAGNRELEEQLQEKDDELEILQEQISTLEKALGEMSLDRSAASEGESLAKLRNIIDAILKSGAERIQESVFEFESPMQAGNQNSTPSYVLSVIEKTSSAATDFSSSFNNYVVDGPNGNHAEIIQGVTTLANAVGDVLINIKGLARLARDDYSADDMQRSARSSAQLVSDFFLSLVSAKLDPLSSEDATEVVINKNIEVQKSLQALSRQADALVPRNAGVHTQNGDLSDVVDREMSRVADAVDTATAKLQELSNRPRDPSLSTYEVKVHNAILAAAIALTSAIAALIRAATECQNEIVNAGRGSQSRTAYYKKHNRWTEGLISAAKAVAGSTNILIETADGVLSNHNTPEQLIVASNEVAASTAQLVAASRVKANFMSKTQDKLEVASKSVTSACRSLVTQVQDILAERTTSKEDMPDYSAMSAHEFRTASMEQQVEVLKLEQALTAARNKLFEIRKIEYMNEEEEDS
uniref:ARAD1D19316p n=1 Tax=Blastobotrys adeninivorans TaxID=409370 RepID=A0A060TG10_BLAAD